jgi:hypothetical protein
MNYLNLIVIACLCLLLVTAGCVENPSSEQRERQSTTAGVHLENVSADGEQVDLAGEVVLENPIYNVTVHNVVLEFVAENGSTIRTITIGDMESGNGTQLPTVEFNASFSRPPTELRLRTGRIENPDNVPFYARGERLKSENPVIYTGFKQDEY